ncbi:MAG: leucine-rich repeat protein [Clostridia bacterium]|nr:leucine-rich repeat protein [Clostridia bacterium]
MKKKLTFLALTLILILSVCATTVFATTEAASLKITAANLSLENAVYMNFKVTHENIDRDDVKLLVWEEMPEAYTKGTEDTCLSAKTDKDGNTFFHYTDLTAKDMTKLIYACAYAKIDGVEYYSSPIKYSIAIYAHRMKASSTDAELLELIDAMLEYGALAQKYFNHNTDILATAPLYQISVNGGKLEDGFAIGWYHEGATAILTANEAEEGYVFSHWTNSVGETVGETETLEVIINGIDNYTAVCERNDITHKISVDNGVLEDGFTVGWYREGTQATLTANEPSKGYVFSHWVNSLGEIVGKQATLMVTVNSEEFYTAIYKMDTSEPEDTEIVYNMPVLSDEKAAVFIGFITNNSNLTQAVAENQEWYQIMTNTYKGDDFAEKAKAFTTTVLSTISSQATESVDNSEYLRQDLVAFFEDEAFFWNIDSFQEGVELGFDLLGVMTENLDLGLIIDSLYGGIEKVNDFVSDLTLFVKGSEWALECEKAGRYTYFCRYINNRNSFRTYYSIDDMNETDYAHFQTLMAGCRFDAAERNQFAAFIDGFTWITHKESFLNHFDLLDEWAEYIYQLNFYVNHTNFHKEDIPSEGLSYTSISNGYMVSGIGTCKDTKLIIPSVYNGKPVVKIAESAFKGCTQLKSIVIPDSVTEIGKGAFSGCSNIESMTIPFVGSSSDNGPNYTSTSHPEYCFGYIFGTDAYEGATKIFQTVGTIDSKGFYIPDSLNTIIMTGNYMPYGAFSRLNVEKIILLGNIYQMFDSSFYGNNGISEIRLPKNCAYIGCTRTYGFWDMCDVFQDCDNLKAIYIPKTLKFIGKFSFDGCDNLTDVYYEGTEEEWKAISIGDFNDCLTNATIHYNHDYEQFEEQKDDVDISDILGEEFKGEDDFFDKIV